MTLKDFYERYICINLSDYRAFEIDLEINKIILLVLVGLLISTLIISYKRAIMMKVIKKLLRYEAFSEDCAISLFDMKLDSFFVRREVEGETRLHRIIRAKGEVDQSYEEYLEESKKKDKNKSGDQKNIGEYYIRADRIDEAKKIASQRDITVLNTLLLCVLYIIVFVSIILLMPEILSLINKLIIK